MAKSTPKQEVRGRRKTTSFSVVSNPVIDDKKISPAAGWLYVLIQRWITFNAEDFVCSKSFLLSKFNAGEFMFNRAWDELKDAGYLKMFSHPTEGWEFELLDEPKADEPHTYYLDLNGEVKSTNIDRAKKKAAKQKKAEENDHYPENHPNGDHYPENHSNGNHSNGNHSNGNHSNGKQGNNINTPDNNSFNNNSVYNHSINQGAEAPAEPSAPKKQFDRVIDGSLIEKVKNQICYDDAIRNNPMQTEMVNYIVECLAQLYVANKPMVFSNVTYDPQFIQDRAAAFTYDHVGYVIDSYMKQTGEIYNVRAYLLTSVFNAPASFMVVEDRMHLDYVSANSKVDPEPADPAEPGAWLKQA